MLTERFRVVWRIVPVVIGPDGFIAASRSALIIEDDDGTEVCGERVLASGCVRSMIAAKRLLEAP